MVTNQKVDYYNILGIERTADQKSIKSAYRKLARRYHPDLNQDDRTAEERFKEVNEAYDVLSDASTRKLYDRFGADWERYRDAGFTGDEPASGPNSRPGGAFTSYPSGNGGGFQFETGTDAGFGDLFESLFNRRPGPQSPRGRQGKIRGENVEVAVEISFDEAFKGTTRRIDIKTPDTCGTCKGSGFARNAPCPTCDGSGTVAKTRTIEIKVPAGVATGARIRAAGQGGPGANGGPNGDVWLNVTVRPHPRFERAGDDVKTEVEVPLYTAVLGGEAVIPTITGKVAMGIPAGSQQGRVFRLRGQGMPKLKGKEGERGDLLARIKIVIPTSLSDEERELFERLRALGH